MSKSEAKSSVEHPFRTVEISDPSLETEGLRWVTVKSRALGQRCDVCVFECPGAAEAGPVPVVILLHGVYGSHWAWALKGSAHRTAARLVSEGVIRPMVLVMPSDGLWGDGSGYLPHRTQDFERWIVEEVPLVARLASSACSAESPLLIAGLSMGGFGALRLAAKYPRKFAAASAHSAAAPTMSSAVPPPAASRAASCALSAASASPPAAPPTVLAAATAAAAAPASPGQ